MDQFPPQVDLNIKDLTLLSKQIRDALEEHGCMVVKFDDKADGKHLNDEIVAAMESLFSLPRETKRKIASVSSLYRAYVEPTERMPYYEGLSIQNSASTEGARNFTQLVWPDGNDKFSQTLNSTSKQLLSLAHNIMDLIIRSYGLDNHERLCLSNVDYLCRIAKYSTPAKAEATPGLGTHVDVGYITILCQNDVQGLMLKLKDGEWKNVNFGNGSLIVFAGSMIQAWSNGRFFASPHKVMISGEEDRYSFVLFLDPKEEDIIEAPSKLIDNEHPALYRPFAYKDYRDHFQAKYSREGTLEEFASI